VLVSLFLFFGEVLMGGRPGFDVAGGPDTARSLYEAVVRELRSAHLPVATGEFQAMMQVELVNDGPVTILVDSKRQF
jgi:D-tyrosyl-tRNA(Tyr) deacylase